MVANFAKKSACLLILVIPTAIAADARNIRQSATAFAGENLARATIVLSDAMESCKKVSKVISIPRANEIGVSRNELLLGFGYFYLKRQNECIEEAAKEFFLAAEVLRKGLDGALNKAELDEALELVDVVLADWWAELEAKARYHAQVPESHRAKIEKLPGIGKPFDMIHSWDMSDN